MGTYERLKALTRGDGLSVYAMDGQPELVEQLGVTTSIEARDVLVKLAREMGESRKAVAARNYLGVGVAPGEIGERRKVTEKLFHLKRSAVINLENKGLRDLASIIEGEEAMRTKDRSHLRVVPDAASVPNVSSVGADDLPDDRDFTADWENYKRRATSDQEKRLIADFEHAVRSKLGISANQPLPRLTHGEVREMQRELRGDGVFTGERRFLDSWNSLEEAAQAYRRWLARGNQR